MRLTQKVSRQVLPSAEEVIDRVEHSRPDDALTIDQSAASISLVCSATRPMIKFAVPSAMLCVMAA
jgi:hypothetical protein